MAGLKYISHYPEHIQDQAKALIEADRLGDYLKQKYPETHQLQSDKALYQYVTELKNRHMKNVGTLSQVSYNSKLKVLKQALGIHTHQSRVQGSKLK